MNLINIQYIPRTMVVIAKETLTALCKKIFIGLALFGCGLACIPITFEDIDKL
jgi:hypothetical protein